MAEMGNLFVVMGPSGVGKTSLLKTLVERFGVELNLALIPTYTTRSMRPGERDGVDYFFVSQARFDELLSSGGLLEWSKAYQAYYGLGRQEVEAAVQAGKNVLVALDRYGAQAIKRQLPEAHIIRIVPPNFETLRERLVQRGTTNEELIAFRLKQAEIEAEEEKYQPIAEYIIINDLFEKSVIELKERVMDSCIAK